MKRITQESKMLIVAIVAVIMVIMLVSTFGKTLTEDGNKKFETYATQIKNNISNNITSQD